MVDKIRLWLARFIAPRHYEDIDNRVNQRVALTMSRMDPFEPLMKEFHGVFSEEYEHPEEKLDARGQLLMKMLGYQLRDDPSFKYLIDWIMNTQGNAAFKAPTRTNEERGEVLMYGKAQISTSILLKRELKRLASLYEEMKGDKPDAPDLGTVAE